MNGWLRQDIIDDFDPTFEEEHIGCRGRHR
jgi:hypothetical protein